MIIAVAVQFCSRGLLMSGPEHATNPLPPVSATRGKSRWAPVSVEQGIVNIKGGYNKRGEAAHSIQYQVGGATHVFVELDKNAHWFLKGVGGPGVQKGALKPVHAMQLLRDRFQQALHDGPGGNEQLGAVETQENLSAVTGPLSESQETDDPDPMDEMVEMVEVVAKKKTAKAKQRARHPIRAAIASFEVPTRPRCTGRVNGGTTFVYVYKKPSSDKRGNGNLYLRCDCIGWLLAYAADELHFQGIDQDSPESSEELVGNCPAVADLNLEWDFGAQSWQATFVAGVLNGTTKLM